MPDYALMNQYLYEGKAKEVEQMTKDALAEGRHFQEVLTEGLIAGMSVVGAGHEHSHSLQRNDTPGLSAGAEPLASA